MAWLWRRFAANQEQDHDPLLHMENQFSGKLEIRTRNIGPLAPDTSDAESTPRLPSTPFAGRYDSMSDSADVSQEIREWMRHGSGIQALVDTCPEEVITVLKDHAVVKLGTFQVRDSEVLKAFGKTTMLTRGCHVLNDPDYELHWKDYLTDRICQRPGAISIGWEEMVSLGAYAVNMRDVAGRDRGALLQLLIQKYTSGATSKKIWEFPAVRAVITFHWQHWAKRFLLLSAIVYLGWMMSFVIYLILYIENDFDGFELDAMSPVKGISSILNFLCFVFMIPFAVVEAWTMIKQKQRWLQSWNLIDLSALTLQTFIFTCHIIGWPLQTKWFGSVLACQCVLLFTKIQYYGRVLGVGASISEIFLSVMYEVRYLMAYILLSGISASLCLGALYKKDKGFAHTSNERNFKGVRNSLVTTFHIIFGAFDTDYILDADYPWVKMLFFFGLQVLMTITVLNLVIAVMTEAYSKFSADQRIRYNRGRALVIDELEVLGIPSLFKSVLKPYIHFLVVEKRIRGNASCRPSLAGSSDHSEDLRKKVDNLSEKFETLFNLIAARNGDIHFASPTKNKKDEGREERRPNKS